MNSLKCVIVTILCCLGIICKGQEVSISQEKTKRDESRCTLAEPTVTCTDYDSCIVENGLEFLTNAGDQDNGFWIGYAKTWISYAYVGCGQLIDGASYSVSTLGECRRKTGCQTFGIQSSTAGLRCKCASDNFKRRKCGVKCEEADQYPCGDTAHKFSFYTVENVPPSNNSQDIHRNCLLFYYNYRPDYNAMAMAEIQSYDQSNELWAQAVENCVAEEKFPASIQSIKNTNFTNNDAQNHWTGIIKTESIISLNDILDNSTYPPLKYAYVMLINEKYYVKFAEEDEMRKSLCTGGSTAGLAAGVSVSLVVLIIVTVIVLVFFKRRGLLTKCYKQNDENSNHTKDTATEIACISTPIFESTTNTMDDLTATNHSYFVLEKTFDEETNEDTEHYAEPDTTDVDHYDLTEMSQNDTNDDNETAHDKNSSARSDLSKPNNTYNKVTLHRTNEYDHIHQDGMPPKSDRQTENEYDISNNLIDGKGHNNIGDDSDTYNHLNKHELKSSDTDNVYGKSETDGDSGYDTSSALTLRRNMDADYDVIKKKW
ncbi:hypothetical protein MAR_014408 [Mya arenaria]|uniref:Uncharacterized protein n=1 Tax=Mya arenaria TaxID=6604 RepID=A0ABY7G5R8_MYAAR|nr:hypothetical protein MAR_014408 [Mya arenaria]